MSAPTSPPANAGQKVLIDARRHAECAHPKAQSLATLEFLHCWRCGVDYCDGRLEYFTIVLQADDPPGVQQNSSYMGTHWEEAAAQLVGAETTYPLAAEEEVRVPHVEAAVKAIEAERAKAR